jgi:hypothetical protein
LEIVAQGMPVPPPAKPDVPLGDIGRSNTGPELSVYNSGPSG